MFQLIEAVPHDAERLAQFAEKTYRDTFAKDNRPEDMNAYVARAFSYQIQLGELRDPKRLIVLALKNNEIAGYYHLIQDQAEPSVLDPSPVELMRLYVDRQWKGNGLAHTLMRSAIERSREWGAKTLWLGVWERNHRAQAFYKKWGFQEVGSHNFQMGSDAQRDLILSKKVSL